MFLIACFGGHAYSDLRENMQEERHNSPTNNRQGGTDIDLLHISGSSGEGVSTVIIFIVTILLLSLAGVALWFLWRCIRDCTSDDERDLRKTRKYEQKFSNLLDKQDKELQRIAELEERFELQAECLQLDKARILQMLQRPPIPPHPSAAARRRRQTSGDSDSGDSIGGGRTPLMLMPPEDRSSSMRWALQERPEGHRMSILPPLTGSKQLSKSRENTSASGWSIGDETAKTLGGQWNTYGGPLPKPGWDTATKGRLSQTCPKPSGLPRTIISTGSSKSSGNTGVSSVATLNRVDTSQKAVSFENNCSSNNISTVRADIHSPSGPTSNVPGLYVGPKKKRPSPSSAKVSADMPLQPTSFPRLSDVGSDREADSSLEFSRMFEALDRSRVSTPKKVGTLPFVPRLDKPDQAVPTGEVSAMEGGTTSSSDRAVSRMDLSTPSPVPAPRLSTLLDSRRQEHKNQQTVGDFPLTKQSKAHQIVEDYHRAVQSTGVPTLSRSVAPNRLVDVGSEEECRSLPVYVHDSSDDCSGMPRRGPSRHMARLTARQGRHQSSGDVSLTDVILRICLLYTSPSPRDRTRSRMPSSA